MSDEDLNTIDERGTRQEEGVATLERFCTADFNDDIDQAAVALGRTPEHLREVLSGGTPMDDDLAQKVRGIAQERGIEVE